MKLIDKDTVVAEIERKLKNIDLNYVCAGSHPSDFDTNKKLRDGVSKNLQSLLSFLDTLEVKEIDLEKEYEDYVVDDPIFGNFITNDTMGMNLAKHFFELGLKTQN
jgi:hypothetical protein